MGLDDKTAQIGIVLTILSFCFAFLLWFIVGAFFSSQHLTFYDLPISEFAFYTIMCGPSIALTIAGLTLYIRGRREFWKAHRELNARLLLSFFGAPLIYLGAWFSWETYRASVYYSTKMGPPWDKPLGYYLALNSPYFILFAFWFISGVILLADALFVLTKMR